MFYEDRAGGISVYIGNTTDFPPHIHHNIEWVICFSGTIMITCNDRTEILHPGDMMISFPNDIHSYTNTEYGNSITLMFDPNILSLFDPQLNIRKYDNFLLGSGQEFLKIAEAALQEFKSDRSLTILYGYINVLWGMTMKVLPYKEYGQNVEADLLLKALKIISERYRSPISLKMVAKEVGVDPCHLSRVFSQKIPCGFLRYVQELRTEYAKGLLKRSGKSIYIIAEESGFSNSRSFNRVFKSVTGKTPGEFRKKL